MSILNDAVTRFESRHGRAPIILFDADGVKYDWTNWFIHEYDRIFPALPLEPITTFGFIDDYDGDPRAVAIKAIMDLPGFYRTVPVMPGAVPAYHAVHGAGATVRTLTSPWLDNPTCADDKLAAIRRDFGLAAAEATVIARDKTFQYGDVLIDDKPRVHGANPHPFWTHVLFAQPYNEGLDKPRIDSWTDEAAWQTTLAGVLDEL